jgi:Chorismate synthase
MNTFGERVKITIFGEAKGPAVGAVLDGLPYGEEIDSERIALDLAYRAAGMNEVGGDQDLDEPAVSSGLLEGRTTGAPLCILIRRPGAEYVSTMPGNIPRPGHGDLTSRVRFGGFADTRGGGVNSGRLMSAVVAAGSVCRQILERRGILIEARVVQIGKARSSEIDYAMKKELLDARASGDSVGGVIQCTASGVPAGLGGLMFGSVESKLSSVLFAVPGVRGVEFGAGFEIAEMRGSQANDPICINEGRIFTETNHAGGINGGITSGMPLVVRCAMRPTPSISREQRTVNLETLENTTVRIRGRNDPCLAPRAVPVIEAAVALCLMDIMVE